MLDVGRAQPARWAPLPFSTRGVQDALQSAGSCLLLTPVSSSGPPSGSRCTIIPGSDTALPSCFFFSSTNLL